MNRIAAWGATLLAFAVPSLAAAASTFITLQSEVGDPMGQTLAGASPQPFTTLNGAITVTSNARNGVSVQFVPSPGSENLYLDFGPRTGNPFVEGRYEIPQRFPVAAATRPALEVYRDGHRCSVISGRFVVLDLTRDATGAIVTFAADFEQHCDGSVPALYGGVRINSNVPYTQTPLPRTVVGSTAGGPVTLSIASPDRPCAFISAKFTRVENLGPVAFPYGVFPFFAGCDPAAGPVTFTLSLIQPPADNVVLWKYGPTPDQHTSHWYTIPTTVVGNVVSFQITDNQLGDDDLPQDGLPDGIIYNYGGLTTGGIVQDLWWAGPMENGWGMSIVQHGVKLFCVIYMYDAAGNPTWLVMPDGEWSGPYGSYTGSLYRPHGTPFYAYDSGFFSPGSPVGTATITFPDLDHAALDYTIDGVTGHKDIVRQLFGPTTTAPLPASYGDLWWGGKTQNGYGIAVLEQQASLFSVWYTYDANGNPTWFVMPDGSWTDSAQTTYAGRIYQTTGSPWLGAAYDPSKLHVTDVGSFSLHFDAPTSPFSYSVQGRTGTLQLQREPF
ncbi:MAG TPA: choice-of-anchor U domain-containing protein [Usitatibacter sp.]|nr:choice-of-anchor U domain-containing protein [Usitatibacter sp.]